MEQRSTGQWTFADAKAAYKFANNLIVTSPNVDYIPKFPSIEDGIYVRADGSFGPQEFSRWPQIFTKSLCHYCAIPTAPKDITCPLWESSILFRLFTRNDWEPVEPLPELTEETASQIDFAGGRLQKDLAVELEKALERAIEYGLKNDDGSKTGVYSLGRALAYKARGAMHRLKVAPDRAFQVVFTVKDIQRDALELHGIYNYMTIFKNRIESISDILHPAGPYVGCFSESAAEVQMLYRIGIPVWYMRRHHSLLNGCRIQWVPSPEPFSPTVTLERWSMLDGTKLQVKVMADGGHIRDVTGLYYDKALSQMMEDMKSISLAISSGDANKQSRSLPVKSDAPKKAPHTKRIGGSQMSRTASEAASGLPRAQKRRKTGTSTEKAANLLNTNSPSFQYHPTCCPDAPPLPLACQEALEGNSPLPRPEKAVLYFFPPPWIIYSPDFERRNRYFHNYLRIRNFCLRRQHSEHIEDLPRNIEYWREAVKGNYKRAERLPKGADENITRLYSLLPMAESSSNSSHRNRKKYLAMTKARAEFGCNGELLPYDPLMIVKYRDREISLSDLQEDRLRHEIQFELHEMNWRAEILALDIEIMKSDTKKADLFSVEFYSQRRQLIFSIWSNNTDNVGVLLFPDFENDATLFPGENMEKNVDRKPYSVSRLYAVLSAWPGFRDSLKDFSEKSISDLTSLQLHALVKLLFRFYTSKFCSFFHRLPVLPCSPV